jgi:hypothetical protein
MLEQGRHRKGIPSNRQVQALRAFAGAGDADSIYMLRRNYVRENKSNTVFALMANMRETTMLEQGCRQKGPVRADLTPTELEAHLGACNRLLGAAPTFQQTYEAVSAGLGHLEEVYRREKIAQTRLLETGQKLE